MSSQHINSWDIWVSTGDKEVLRQRDQERIKISAPFISSLFPHGIQILKCPPCRQAFSPSPTSVLMDVVFLMMSPLFIKPCGDGNYVHVSWRSHVAFIWRRDARETVCGTGGGGVGIFKTLSWILKSNVLVPHSGFGLALSLWLTVSEALCSIIFLNLFSS